MSIGVQRINYNNPSGSYQNLSLWEVSAPVFGNYPKVHPVYYSMVFSADFIGTSGKTRVAELPLPVQDTDDQVAYGAYDDGKLARLAVISYAAPNGNSTAFSFDLGADSGVKQVELRKLVDNAHAMYTGAWNITWAGMSWKAANEGVGQQVLNDTIVKTVDNGLVEFDVLDNEAVMAILKY